MSSKSMLQFAAKGNSGKLHCKSCSSSHQKSHVHFKRIVPKRKVRVSQSAEEKRESAKVENVKTRGAKVKHKVRKHK